MRQPRGASSLPPPPLPPPNRPGAGLEHPPRALRLPWALLALFWPVQLLLAVFHWERMRRPMYLQLAGVLLVVAPLLLARAAMGPHPDDAAVRIVALMPGDRGAPDTESGQSPGLLARLQALVGGAPAGPRRPVRYQWTDERGDVHVTESPGDVPARYHGTLRVASDAE